MSGNKDGGAKAAATIKRKYGEDYYKIQGAIGGSNGHGHKFGHGKLDPVAEGIKGGKISRRTWSEEQRKEHGKRMREIYENLN